ncbi:MAG TPA: serine protease [Gemmatimonadales bacterium]|nr:serine protease [Gemmatimonadales bacterium]
MRIRSPLTLATLAAAATPLLAQQPGGPMSLETIRKAVVTVHALDADGQAVASGTGFFVAPEGMVVTAAHVLSDAAGCSIELSDGETMRCTVAASDTSKDVMMLQVGGTPPAMLRWGSSAAAKDGDEISVVSNPLGQLPGTLSKGIISASRVVSGNKLLQISAPISHGSSGAPLLNAQSQVIGVIRSTIERGQSLNFATATDAIRNMHMDPAAVAEAQGFLRKPALAQRAEPLATSTAATSGRTIAVGQAVAGRLTDDDEVYSDTTYYQRWQLTPRAGQDVTIDLSSTDFDPVLIVRGAADTSMVNDDGGPKCASRVVFTARSSSPVTILVNTTSSPHSQTGRFTLAVSEGSKPVDATATRDAPGDCRSAPSLGGALREIAVGQTVNGSLSETDPLYPDTTYYQRWIVSARPGQDVTIDLSSAEFDPVLIVRGTADSSIVNDDGGPGCASRVVFTAPSSAPDTIIVNTTAKPLRQTGRYTLTVSSGRKPVDPIGTEDRPDDCRPPS